MAVVAPERCDSEFQDRDVSLSNNFPKQLVDKYNIETFLGQGAFSTVWRCVHRSTGQIRAIKKIDTSELSPREIAHEIAIMRLLRNGNVVKCYDVFLDKQFINIVIDMFTGGDLIDCLNAHRKDHGRIPDGQLANLSRQMLLAVQHVHSLMIVHRDVKGENFLSDRPDIGDPCCQIALADFGTAIRINPGEHLNEHLGTPEFWAPEVWAGSYEFRMDVWSVGVVSYILLTGALPFQDQEQVCKPVEPGMLPFRVPPYATRPCVDFLGACMTKDYRKRLSADEAAQLPWMSTPTYPRNKAPATQSKATPPEVSKSSLGGKIIKALLASGVCCATGFGLCITTSVAASAKLIQKATSFEIKRVEVAGPSQDELEKQVTELTKHISTSAGRPAYTTTGSIKEARSIKAERYLSACKGKGKGTAARYQSKIPKLPA